MPERRRPRWPLRQWITVTIGAAIAICVTSIVIGALAIASLSDNQHQLVDRIDPAVQEALRLDNALLDQESGVRGYVLTADPVFLDPYHEGIGRQEDAVTSLRELVRGHAELIAELERVAWHISLWRKEYATPVIDLVQADVEEPQKPLPERTEAAKQRFDAVRGASNRLQAGLERVRAESREALDRATNRVVVVSVAVAVVLLLIFVLLTLVLRGAVVGPLTSLAGQVRRVSDGDFQHAPKVTGPQEIVTLADGVDSMRRRILDELAAQREINAELDLRTEDLARSNSELEQFAYVASHDLQEPLRKVASFCQLLERRYKGQLDERADQYIGFAVDGAKRMQVLINDLLAFSRVGRHVNDHVLLSAADIVEQAKVNLAHALEDAGAEVEVGDLPVVRGEAALLTAVFQNLIGNAVKFRGEELPRIRVEAVRDGDFYEFSVSDNGIGIEPEYAERVFVIFQRLHGKEEYPGTGIGLAMCRKIIEYHGGRIWLDQEYASGTRFRFTLPVPDTLDAEDAEAPPTPDRSEETQ
ncbi:sensor histidine kinase [Actinokineospora fastidiosa]|uniref:histidine kinase n=1 Tax=Actinokineospora fastidiosa TaxID=1816 RepID=A0A918GQZ0_9PSEU|nr:sensor histidine kinase [Actinokineospora fastidiosa]GGS55811.1 histidine kinase [Actinokineospora fastidiosa]